MKFMNNGKAFPSLDDMACSNPWHDQPQFLPGHREAKKYCQSQIKNKRNRRNRIVELLIPTLNKFISYQFLLTLLEGANHE